MSTHVLKMKGYLDTLEKLDVRVPQELATGLILGSLSDAYDQFVMAYDACSDIWHIRIYIYIYNE